MSRSRKKVPIIKDSGHKTEKNYANRKLRRAVILEEDNLNLNGGSYKKYSESWDICDFTFLQTEQQAIDYYNATVAKYELSGSKFFIEEYPTVEDYLRWWKQQYINK